MSDREARQETLSDETARKTLLDGRVQWETLFDGRRVRKPSLMEGLRKKPCLAERCGGNPF